MHLVRLFVYWKRRRNRTEETGQLRAKTKPGSNLLNRPFAKPLMGGWASKISVIHTSYVANSLRTPLLFMKSAQHHKVKVSVRPIFFICSLGKVALKTKKVVIDFFPFLPLVTRKPFLLSELVETLYGDCLVVAPSSTN